MPGSVVSGTHYLLYIITSDRMIIVSQLLEDLRSCYFLCCKAWWYEIITYQVPGCCGQIGSFIFASMIEQIWLIICRNVFAFSLPVMVQCVEISSRMVKFHYPDLQVLDRCWIIKYSGLSDSTSTDLSYLKFHKQPSQNVHFLVIFLSNIAFAMTFGPIMDFPPEYSRNPLVHLVRSHCYQTFQCLLLEKVLHTFHLMP